jgi:small subunit ribosomal protein S20
MRTSAEENAQNRAVRSRMKKYIKELEACKVKSDAETKLKQVVSVIDKAVRDKVIHKNKAARDKSRLMAKINSLPA